jgi:DNA-binding LacI/PurR family transcriptional regulator
MDLLTVPISSFDQNATQIGDRAANILLKRIESGPKSSPTRVLIPHKLIVRNSSAVAANTKSDIGVGQTDSGHLGVSSEA